MTTADLDRPTDFAPVLVRATNVSRRFGDRLVLDAVSIEIARGEVVTMLGRSGAGKSTFLRILGGFDPGADGTVTVPGRRAIVFQAPRLLPWKKVLPNVIFGLRSADRVQRGRTALTEVGLTAREKAWPATLSGGEAQRVALARAFVRDPELLLLDEPFGALDALTRLKMHELVVNLLRRHRPATLLVTHDVEEAIALSDRVVVLTDGRISADVRIEVERPRHRDSAEFLQLRRQLLQELGVSPAAI